MTQKNDLLKELFDRMPEEELPVSFRDNMMQQIMREAERIRKRDERWGWIAVIATSLLMIAIAVASFLYIGIPEISIRIPDLSILPFYVHIGMLALILLGADHKCRQIVAKRQMLHKKRM